jgi:hypothetical protein
VPRRQGACSGERRHRIQLRKPIYPNAHGGDSIFVLWSMSTEQAEQLAADIIAAVKAVREAQAKPAEDCFCAADHGREVR